MRKLHISTRSGTVLCGEPNVIGTLRRYVGGPARTDFVREYEECEKCLELEPLALLAETDIGDGLAAPEATRVFCLHCGRRQPRMAGAWGTCKEGTCKPPTCYMCLTSTVVHNGGGWWNCTRCKFTWQRDENIRDTEC